MYSTWTGYSSCEVEEFRMFTIRKNDKYYTSGWEQSTYALKYLDELKNKFPNDQWTMCPIK